MPDLYTLVQERARPDQHITYITDIRRRVGSRTLTASFCPLVMGQQFIPSGPAGPGDSPIRAIITDTPYSEEEYWRQVEEHRNLVRSRRRRIQKHDIEVLMIDGPSGTGKSTLATVLSEDYGMGYIHGRSNTSWEALGRMTKPIVLDRGTPSRLIYSPDERPLAPSWAHGASVIILMPKEINAWKKARAINSPGPSARSWAQVARNDSPEEELQRWADHMSVAAYLEEAELPIQFKTAPWVHAWTYRLNKEALGG